MINHTVLDLLATMEDEVIYYKGEDFSPHELYDEFVSGLHQDDKTWCGSLIVEHEAQERHDGIYIRMINQDGQWTSERIIEWA